MTAIKQQHIEVVTPEYAERKARREASPHRHIWQLLDQVCDPELPGLTIWDLGVLQDVRFMPDTQIWRVDITPTYSGCPAVDTIISDIRQVLDSEGVTPVQVKVVLSPTWSTDLMSPQGRAQLAALQITPPLADDNEPMQCPHCGSEHCDKLSEFGSTACKALYQCRDCGQPFDYFKHF